MFARYTVVLKDLLENTQTKPLITKALSTYPLYHNDKTYDLIPTREELNERLLNHYKYREIGFETVGRFLDELEITMKEIMPYYNERFKTIVTMEELDNIFDNVDIVETIKDKRTINANASGSGTATTEGESHNNSTATVNDSMDSVVHKKSTHADTPQDELSITAKNIDNVNYADTVQWDKEENNKTGSSTSTSEGTNNDSSISESSSETESQSIDEFEHTFTKRGNQGIDTLARNMKEYRTIIIDVVNEIINDKRVQSLFMLVY